MRSLSRWIAAVAAAALVGALASCAPPPAPAGGSRAGSAGPVTPTPTPTLDVRDVARASVRDMPLRARAASIVMASVPSTDPAELHGFMARTGAGGLILMRGNIPGSPEELRALTAALVVDPALPPLIAIDEEGGDVARLPWDDLPGALTLKTAPPDAARAAFADRARLLREAGANVNFGVVADVTADPEMFIHRRALGETPAASAERTAAAVAGERGLVASTLKHFPGHGAAPGDSHRELPETDLPEADWAVRDAVPFAAGIEAGAEMLMFGHLVYSSVDGAPASLSAAWHRIARERLGSTASRSRTTSGCWSPPAARSTQTWRRTPSPPWRPGTTWSSRSWARRRSRRTG